MLCFETSSVDTTDDTTDNRARLTTLHTTLIVDVVSSAWEKFKCAAFVIVSQSNLSIDSDCGSRSHRIVVRPGSRFMNIS